MRRVEAGLDAVKDVVLALAVACLAAMLVINTVNILSRSLAGHSFNWVFPWTILLFLWMTFLGLYVYLRTRRDVVVDVLVARLPHLPRLGLALAADAIGIAVMVVILRGAVPLIRLQLGEMETIALPQYLRSLPLFIASGLVILHFASHIVGLLTGRHEPFPSQTIPGSPESGSPE